MLKIHFTKCDLNKPKLIEMKQFIITNPSTISQFSRSPDECVFNSCDRRRGEREPPQPSCGRPSLYLAVSWKTASPSEGLTRARDCTDGENPRFSGSIVLPTR